MDALHRRLAVVKEGTAAASRVELDGFVSLSLN